MSDDLRERTPDAALGDDPAVRGTRSDIGATGSGVTGPAPGMQEVREANEDGNKAGSAMDSGDAEAGRGASTDDETSWLRSASGEGSSGQSR